MKLQGPPSPDFAAAIGLDWADAEHAICLQAAGAATREHSVLAHRAACIEAWAQTLRQRFKGQPVAVALALDQGPIVAGPSRRPGTRLDLVFREIRLARPLVVVDVAEQ